jgi:hypothetical protein
MLGGPSHPGNEDHLNVLPAEKLQPCGYLCKLQRLFTVIVEPSLRREYTSYPGLRVDSISDDFI